MPSYVPDQLQAVLANNDLFFDFSQDLTEDDRPKNENKKVTVVRANDVDVHGYISVSYYVTQVLVYESGVFKKQVAIRVEDIVRISKFSGAKETIYIRPYDIQDEPTENGHSCFKPEAFEQTLNSNGISSQLVSFRKKSPLIAAKITLLTEDEMWENYRRFLAEAKSRFCMDLTTHSASHKSNIPLKCEASVKSYEENDGYFVSGGIKEIYNDQYQIDIREIECKLSFE